MLKPSNFGPTTLEPIKISKEFLALAAHDLQIYQKSIQKRLRPTPQNWKDAGQDAQILSKLDSPFNISNLQNISPAVI